MHNKNINLMWTATIAVVLVSFGFLGGCTCCATAEKGPVRAAVYVDKGARNTGVYRWLELTALAKGMVSTPVDAEMIRAGALDSQDLLIVPGGRSPQKPLRRSHGAGRPERTPPGHTPAREPGDRQTSSLVEYSFAWTCPIFGARPPAVRR